MSQLAGLQMPHEPYVKVYGVVAKECIVFKSAIQPMRLAFNVRKFAKDWKVGDDLPEITKSYAVFKNGDDVRQDQLILQLFNIMDALLKKVNIDF